MKKTYIAVQLKKGEKWQAFVIDVNESTNLIAKFNKGWGNGVEIFNASICSTKKRAFELAELWNEGFKKSNRYMY